MLESISLICYHLQPWFLPLIVLVLFIKTYLFFVYRKPKWRFGQFVYFRSRQIASAGTLENVTIKVVQNCLSFYLLFLVVVDVLVQLLLF